MVTADEECAQQVEWRSRLVRAVIDRTHDDEILVTMLCAGLNQAHSEGLRDAAWVCQRLADENADARRVATVLAESIRNLDKMNQAIPRDGI